MSTLPGIDESWGRANVDTLIARGDRFIVRYLSDTPGKGITRAEADVYLNRGLGICLVYEEDPKWALGGHQAGTAVAQNALRIARRVGVPEDRPIYLGVDFPMQPSEKVAVVDGFAGAASILSPTRTGIYGGLAAIEAVAASGYADWLWQTYAWSGTPTVWFRDDHLRQYENGQTVGGATVDLDLAMTLDFGAWTLAGVSTLGADVPFDAEQTAYLDAMKKAIIDEVIAAQTWVGAHTDAKTRDVTAAVTSYVHDATKPIADGVNALAAKTTTGAGVPVPTHGTGTITLNLS